MEIKDRIDQEIYDVGAKLIDSPFFEQTKNQIHHKRSNLYIHVMRVARDAVRICDFLERRGIKVNRQDVIIAALCHDLGMIGGHEKYSSSYMACRIHPKESARWAKKYFPGISEKTLQSIEVHMWPLVLAWPHSKEAWIVIQADKMATLRDLRRGEAEG